MGFQAHPKQTGTPRSTSNPPSSAPTARGRAISPTPSAGSWGSSPCAASGGAGWNLKFVAWDSRHIRNRPAHPDQHPILRTEINFSRMNETIFMGIQLGQGGAVRAQPPGEPDGGRYLRRHPAAGQCGPRTALFSAPLPATAGARYSILL